MPGFLLLHLPAIWHQRARYLTSKRQRRRARLSRADRERLADRLHLLADGDHRECSNPFSPNAMTPDVFADLWREHGDEIAARWRETGRQPSTWWLAMARRAGVRLPGSAAPASF